MLPHLQVVKVYPNGKMSKHMGELEVGDSLDIKGPIPKLPYTPNMKQKIGMVSQSPLQLQADIHAQALVVNTGLCILYADPDDLCALLQIAGGSGLTPMLQVAQEITRNPEDKTEVTLVYANVSEDDILLRRELDDMARKHKNFKVCWHPQLIVDPLLCVCI